MFCHVCILVWFGVHELRSYSVESFAFYTSSAPESFGINWKSKNTSQLQSSPVPGRLAYGMTIDKDQKGNPLRLLAWINKLLSSFMANCIWHPQEYEHQKQMFVLGRRGK